MGKKAVELLPVTREALIGTNRLEDLAIIYTMVGNADEAVNTLDRLLSIPSWMSASMLRVDPVWKPLRNNPRFQKLIAEKQ
jgi:serine/threonine-protein kinase